MTAMAREHTGEYAEYIGQKQSAEVQKEIHRQEKDLTSMRKRSAELDVIFKRLYEDSVLDRISAEQFQMLSGCYAEERDALTADIPERETAIQALRSAVSNMDSLIVKAKRHTDITKLTPELLRLFIRKIVVHEKSLKWSKHAGQTVKTHYSGIGCLSMKETQVQERHPRQALPK